MECKSLSFDYFSLVGGQGADSYFLSFRRRRDLRTVTGGSLRQRHSEVFLVIKMKL